MNSKAIFCALLCLQIIICSAIIAQEEKVIPVHIMCVQERSEESSKALNVLLFHATHDDINIYKSFDTDTKHVSIGKGQTPIESALQAATIGLVIQQSISNQLSHKKLFAPLELISYEPDASQTFIFFPVAFTTKKELSDSLQEAIEEGHTDAQYDAVKLVPLRTEYVSDPVSLDGHPELENIVLDSVLHDRIWIDGATLNAIKWLAERLGKSGFAVGVASREDSPSVPKPHSWQEISSNTLLLFYNSNQPFYEFTNFHAGYPVTIDNSKWPTTEHYYQAMKFADARLQNQIKQIIMAHDAFDFAQRHKKDIRSDWQQKSLAYMMNAVKNKFYQHQQLADMLVATYPQVLVENALKNDSFYGAGADGKGENHLGKILMKVRAALRKGVPKEQLENIIYDDQDRKRTWVDFAAGDDEEWYHLPVPEPKQDTTVGRPNALTAALQRVTDAFNKVAAALGRVSF
ncbi:MAG: NADAR family protein [Candidatus Babeliales bacterium]